MAKVAVLEKGVTLDDVKRNEEVRLLIEMADRYLGVIGYTEHGLRHTALVANIAYNVMTRLKRTERQAQLASIAAYMHDIGNVISREYHAQTGALITHRILSYLGMPPEEVLEIMAAIGNHEERGGAPVNEIGAALILADKSDVHRSRVRTTGSIKEDIHDRVNYAATSSFLRVEEEKGVISLELKIDTSISQVMEYFEIFLSRMAFCRRAAEFLRMKFELEINGQRLL
ncbi:MAG: HD domain-containing protein [candidate division Zixibacteria bacterium]|nr:HD domain-containing protein [candidate division Zixibacteria bacterium]